MCIPVTCNSTYTSMENYLRKFPLRVTVHTQVWNFTVVSTSLYRTTYWHTVLVFGWVGGRILADNVTKSISVAVYDTNIVIQYPWLGGWVQIASTPPLPIHIHQRRAGLALCLACLSLSITTPHLHTASRHVLVPAHLLCAGAGTCHSCLASCLRVPGCSASAACCADAELLLVVGPLAHM